MGTIPITPAIVVVDDFESAFVLLTRPFAVKHRLSLRYETFEITRAGAPSPMVIDDGHATTLSYRFSPGKRFHASMEWLEIKSNRLLWTMFLFGTTISD